MILDDKLAAGDVIVLDGATGDEIARLGGHMDDAAWCAVANQTDPNIVRHVHEQYIHAGSHVITTNTFATARHVLAGAGLADQTVAINRRAVEIANEARENAATDYPVAIAGSISCTLAWEPGTVSPDPHYLPTPDQESANYREIAETLAEAGVDLLILEMMLDLEHAPRAIEAAVATGLPVWIGLSASSRPDGSIVGWDSDAENAWQSSETSPWPEPPPFDALVEKLVNLGGQVAGIMHSSIAATTPALDLLRAHWGRPLMAYPETLERDPNAREHGTNVSPADFATAAHQWVDRGVQIVGGCCGTTPNHIRALVRGLPSRVGPRPA